MAAYARLIRVGPKGQDLANFSGEAQLVLSKIVKRHAATIAADIRKAMRAPKSGNLYYYNGKAIIASAPGEAPAIRSGRLYKNITPIIQNNGLQARIDPMQRGGVYYAPWLELGTTKMDPRPYLKPNFDIRRAQFLTEVRTSVAKLLEAT